MLSCPLLVFPQMICFENTYGETDFYDRGNSVCQASDSGYVATGRTASFGNGGGVNLYLFKTNSKGNIAWQKNYGGKGTEEGECVQYTKDGGYIVTGFTDSQGNGASDVYLIKTNSQGDAEWVKTYGGNRVDKGHYVVQVKDGGYIITGATYSYGMGSVNAYLIRTTINGDTLWTKNYGGEGIEEGHCVYETADGGFVLTGRTNSFGSGDYDVYVIYSNSGGRLLWMRTFGGSGNEEGLSIKQTKDGGFIILGHTMSYGAGGTDVYLIRTDSKGEAKWTRTFGGVNDDFGRAVHETADGNFIVVGYTNSMGVGGNDAYLLCVNPDGDTIWTKTYGGKGDEFGNDVRETFDNGFIIAGSRFAQGSAGEDSEKIKDVLLIKTDSRGECITR